MAAGQITITLDGLTAAGAGQATLQIQGAACTLDDPGCGISSAAGLTGVQFAVGAVALQVPPGTPVTGTLTLTATRGSQDPTLTLQGFSAAPGTPMVAWTLPGGGMDSEDLSQGQLVLTGFAQSPSEPMENV